MSSKLNSGYKSSTSGAIISKTMTAKGMAVTTVMIWLLSCLLIAALGFKMGMRTFVPGPSSVESLARNAGEKIAKSHQLEPREDVLVTLRSSDLYFSDPKFVMASDSLWETLRKISIFSKVETIGHGWIDDELFSSKDTHSLMLVAESKAPVNEVAKDLEQLPSILAEWQSAHPEFVLHYLSNATGDLEMFEVINRDLDRSLVWSVPISFLILLWAFGSVVAALIPLVLAMFSLIASLGASAIFSSLVEPISATATQLVVLLVLAIGVDYSLLIISRTREEVSNGLNRMLAIEVARREAGRSVLWSGVTVAISLLGLLLMQDTVLTSMAFVSLLSVAITVISVYWALPAILLCLGERLEYGRVFKRAKPSDAQTDSFLSFSTRRPRLALALGLILIAGVSSAAFMLKLGTTVEASSLPKSMQSAQAFDALAAGFPTLAGPDLSIILTSKDLLSKEEDGVLQPFFDLINGTGSLNGPFKVERSPDETVFRYNFIAIGSVNDEKNKQLVRDLRNEFIPNTLTPHGINAYLSGVLQFAVDDSKAYVDRTPLVFVSVLLLCMVFLLLAFRSLVVPIHAVFLNSLSTAAAFGVLVAVFRTPPIIESFVPALLFAILFGLSMDYHVFLVSRIQEQVLAGLDTKSAVQFGVNATYRTITSAAAIMVSVFAVMATLELPIMKQLGVGLAVAVLIDATIVRLVLLPSSMILLGKYNWFFPKCFTRLAAGRIKI